MQIFKWLFGSHTPGMTETAGWTTSTVPGEKRTILDLFRTDLSNIALAGFTEGKAEVLMNGDIIQNFYKILDYKECGIFDTVYLKIIGGKSVNVVFKSSKPLGIGTSNMKSMIDALYDIYGSDNSDKGLYNANDTSEYTDSQFYVLFGRDWMDYPRYEYPVSLRRYSEEVFISIWGLTDRNIVY